MSDFIIYSDGAASMHKVNNQCLRGAGGWAYVILNNKQEIVYQASGNASFSSNNAMELFAILAALYYFNNLKEEGKTIEIYSDSAYCINIFTQWIANWKKNHWTRGRKHEPIENLELIKDIDNAIEEAHNHFNDIKFVKVKGHSGNKWNEYVDNLAVMEKLKIDK